MKKRIAGLALAAVMAATQLNFVFADVVTDANINVQVNGEAVDFGDSQPVIIDGYSYVPIRSVFEKTGTVDWDSETKAVTLTSGDKSLVIYTAYGEAAIDGETFEMAQKPVIIDGRTLLPVREPAEYLGLEIGWDEETKTVSLSTTEATETTDVESAYSELINAVKGKPLPEAYYIVSENNVDNIADYDVWTNVLMQYADCEGYDALVDVTNRLTEVSENTELSLNDDDVMLLFGEYIAEYYKALDGLEDKSFMEGIYKEMFVNTQSQVIVDESYTPEQTMESMEKFSNGESDTITSMPEMELTMKVIVGMNNYFDNLDENDGTGFESLGYIIMLSSYLNYEASVSPEMFGQLAQEV